MESSLNGFETEPMILYKIGGSLLDLPDLPQRIRSVLQGEKSLLLVGGGAAANVVRQWDEQHALGDESAHKLAIQSMQLSAELLHCLLPETELVSTREQAENVWAKKRWPILQVAPFLHGEESRDKKPATQTEPPLPHDWNCTSDSIAAWIATHWPADKLVLLKSVDEELFPHAVDSHFAAQSQNIAHIKWINLRSNHWQS